MLLFASRPHDTYFSNSPIGWYSYHWSIATNPNYVEFGGAETNTFVFIHGLFTFVILCCAIWMFSKWVLARRTMAEQVAKEQRARNADEAALAAYQKALANHK